MTHAPGHEGRDDNAASRPVSMSPTKPSRLLSGIYRDIGLAAVASGLEIQMDQLAPEICEAVKRGSRYIHLMPRK